MSTIGDRIRERRVAAGLSQSALARLLGVTSTMVIHWERGRSTPPTKRAKQIADALMMDLYELLEEPRAADEAKLLKIFRALPPSKREKMIQLLEASSEVQRAIGHQTERESVGEPG